MPSGQQPSSSPAIHSLLSDQKSTSEQKNNKAQGIPTKSLVKPQELAEHRCQLYAKILKQEFIRELHYVWDVVNNRAPARDSFITQVSKQLQTVLSLLPAGSEVVNSLTLVVQGASAVATYIENKASEEGKNSVASLVDEKSLGYLEILLEGVAREAVRRYESFLINGIKNKEDIQLFAKVGARRMLEYLSRQKDNIIQENKGFLCNEDILLTGLIEGRSGGFVEGWRNHHLALQEGGTVSAETAYARPGFRIFELRNGKQVEEFYVLDEKDRSKLEKITYSQKVKNVLQGETKPFGFTKFKKENGSRTREAKAGYMVMPEAIQKRYGYQLQTKRVPENKEVNGACEVTDTAVLEAKGTLSAAHQKNPLTFMPTRVVIDKATVEKFLLWSKETSNKSLRDYVRAVLQNPAVEWVICREDLTDLKEGSLSHKDLSYTDLSGAKLSGDLSGTQFIHSYLVRTVFEKVTHARGIQFKAAHCEFLQAEGVDFSDGDFTQSHFDYAILKKCKLNTPKMLGSSWAHATLDIEGTEEKSKVQWEELKKELATQRTNHWQALKELHQDLRERTQALYEAQQIFEEQVKKQLAELAPSLLKKLQEQTQLLVEQQEMRLVFEKACQEDLRVVKKALEKTADKEDVEKLQAQLSEIVRQIAELRKGEQFKEALINFEVTMKQELQKLLENKFTELAASITTLGEKFSSQLQASIDKQQIKLEVITQQLTELQFTLKAQLNQVAKKIINTLLESATKPDIQFNVIPSLKESFEKTLNPETFNPDLYIKPFAAMRATDSESFDLHTRVKEFLTAPHLRSLLLLSDSGNGKSSFGHYLVWQLWKNYQPGKIIPLFMHLPTLLKKASTNKEIFADQLLEGYFKLEKLGEKEIKSIMQEPLLLVLDGYDEILEPGNLYLLNNWKQLNVKVITTCRPEALMQRQLGYQELFIPDKTATHKPHERFLELHLKPFNSEQVNQYLQQYIKHSSLSLWKDWKTYRENIDAILGLDELIQTPFILQMVVKILPRIAPKYQEQKAHERHQLTRTKIYDEFVEDWFDERCERLHESGDLNQLKGSLKAYLRTYSENLAYRALVQGRLEIDIEEKATLDPSLLIPRDEKALSNYCEDSPKFTPRVMEKIRFGCLLKTGNSSFSFLHKSLVEYFAAEELFKGAFAMLQIIAKGDLNYAEMKSTAALSAKLTQQPAIEYKALSLTPSYQNEFKTTSSTERYLIKQEEIASAREEKIGAKSPLSLTGAHESLKQKQKPLSFNEHLLTKERGIMQRLVDRVKQDPEVGKLLLKVVKLSKGQPWVATAAANAISILNLAQYCFAGEDFSYVNILGANLSNANLHKVNFSHGNLSGVDFSNAFLRWADFKAALLANAYFGQYPNSWYGTMDFGVDFSIQNEIIWLAVSLNNGDIYIYRAAVENEKWQLVHVIKNCLEESELHNKWEMKFSQDAKFLAVLNDDCRVRIWQVSSGTCLHKISLGSFFSGPLQFSPSGKVLAFGEGSCTYPPPDGRRHLYNIRLFSVKSGKLLSSLHLHKKRIVGLKFNKQGNMLFSWSERDEYGGDKQEVNCIDRDAKNEMVLPHFEENIYDITFSNDDKLVAVTCRKKFMLWDGKFKHRLHTFIINEGITSLEFSPDAQSIAIGCGDHKILIWSVVRQEVEHTLLSYNSSKLVHFNQAGNKLMAISSNMFESWPLGTDHIKQTDLLKYQYLCTSGDGQFIVRRDLVADKIQIFGAVDNVHIHSLNLWVPINSHFLFSHDNTLLAIIDQNTVTLWRMASSKVIHRFSHMIPSDDYSHRHFKFTFSKSDQFFVMWNYHVRTVWNIASGKIVFKESILDRNFYNYYFSSDEKLLVIYNDDYSHDASKAKRELKIWDITAGKYSQKSYIQNCKQIGAVAISPNNNLIACGIGYDLDDYFEGKYSTKPIYLVDGASGKYRHTLQAHIHGVGKIIFNKAGTLLFSTGDYKSDGLIKVWEVSTGKLIRTFSGHKDAVRTFCLNSTEKLLLSGGEDKTARLWEVDTGKCLYTFAGHKRSVMEVLFGYQDKLMITGGAFWDRPQLWDTKTKEFIFLINIHNHMIKDVFFTPDDHYIVSRDEEGNTCLWKIGVVGNNFTIKLSQKYGTYKLNVHGLDMDRTYGLSPNNLRLLEQKGATGKPAKGKDMPLRVCDIGRELPALDIKSDQAVVKLTSNSIASPKLQLSYERWIISVMYNNQSNNSAKIFLVLEGVNQFGKGLLFRYEFLDNPQKPGCAVIAPSSFKNIDVEDMETVFCHDLMKPGEVSCKSWDILREKAVSLIKEIEQDKIKAISYLALNEQAVLAQSANKNAHTSFTWICEKLYNLKEEKIKQDLPEKWEVLITARAGFCLSVLEQKAEEKSCSIM